MDVPLPALAFLGGTGAEGSGLALRFAHAGFSVTLGSRSVDKAKTVADELNAALDGGAIGAAANLAAAEAADIAVLTVPFAAQQATALEVAPALTGKILVDATVPLVPPKVGRVQLPDGGSAVAALQQALGDDIRVVSAFQNVSAQHLRELDHSIDCDVLVSSDDVEAREMVVQLARAIGLRAWHAGPLANSAAAEALTSVLISINRRHKVPGAGIRITGVEDDAGS